MSIKYSYTVVAVDEAARCMEVVYEAEGHQTLHVSARLPYENETLEQVIWMYAPVAYWEQSTRAVVAPTVGATGVVTPAPVPVTEPQPQPLSTGAQTL